MIHKKSIDRYNDKIVEVFRLISFIRDNPIINGSNGLNLQYGSDYDLFEVIHADEDESRFFNKVVKILQNMITKIENDDNTYFIDFKSNNLHWTINEIKTGIKTKDGKKYYLKDMFSNDEIIKIDVISYQNSIYTPFSNIFEFKFNTKSDEINDDIENNIRDDIKKYHADKKSMKMCKRIFSITKDKKLKEKLVMLFNSQCSMLYKINSDIKTMVELLDAGYHDKTIIKNIAHECQYLKEELSKINELKIDDIVFTRLNLMTTKRHWKTIRRALMMLYNKLDKVVNKATKKKMKLLKINIKRYL